MICPIEQPIRTQRDIRLSQCVESQRGVALDLDGNILIQRRQAETLEARTNGLFTWHGNRLVSCTPMTVEKELDMQYVLLMADVMDESAGGTPEEIHRELYGNLSKAERQVLAETAN